MYTSRLLVGLTAAQTLAIAIAAAVAPAGAETRAQQAAPAYSSTVPAEVAPGITGTATTAPNDDPYGYALAEVTTSTTAPRRTAGHPATASTTNARPTPRPAATPTAPAPAPARPRAVSRPAAPAPAPRTPQPHRPAPRPITGHVGSTPTTPPPAPHTSSPTTTASTTTAPTSTSTPVPTPSSTTTTPTSTSTSAFPTSIPTAPVNADPAAPTVPSFDVRPLAALGAVIDLGDVVGSESPQHALAAFNTFRAEHGRKAWTLKGNRSCRLVAQGVGGASYEWASAHIIAGAPSYVLLTQVTAITWRPFEQDGYWQGELKLYRC